MAYDFPTAPSNGQLANGFTWNGYGWVPQVGAGGISDGDKGDIVVSSGGTVWSLDTAVTTSISNKVAKAGDTMTGALAISATTASTSPATGALTVAGGVGVGDHLRVAKQLSVGTVTPITYPVEFHFAVNQNLVAYGSGGAATLRSVNDANTADQPMGFVGSSFSFNGPANFANTTPSTSPTTGALTVAGGVGVGGAMQINGAAAGNRLSVGTTASNPTAFAAVKIGFVAASENGLAFRGNGDATVTVVFQNSLATNVGTIQQSATATSYNTSSDGRLKEDLQSFDAGRIIDDTEVYDFAWKNTKERSYGIVAQQAVEVYPLAIAHNEKDDWWGVDYSKYVPLLLAEVKALRARVAQLEGK